LEAMDKVLATFPEHLREYTARVLWNKHVEVRFGANVVEFDGQRITLKGGEIIPAHTLIWTAGVRTAKLADTLGIPQGKQGRIIVQSTLQVPQFPNIYVIGDAAFMEDSQGNQLPMVATVALQQAEVAAQNILLSIKGEPQHDFIYQDPGSLATIGRSFAVARIGHFEFGGFLAWLMWSVVHVYQLIGFRNRIMVLINWAWDYFLYDRAVRLIIPAHRRNQD